MMKSVAEILVRRGLSLVRGQCDVHGNYETYGRPGVSPRCPDCVLAESAAESARQAHSRRILHLEAQSGIPGRFRSVGFKNFTVDTEEKKQSRAMCWRYASEFKLNWDPLLISGSIGTGKTHLACAIANNLIAAGVSARYMTMSGLLADIKRAYSTDGMSEASQIAKYTEAFDLLILDEADVIRGSDNDLGLIFSVINGRYNNLRPVLIVSNQPASSLGDYLGERTVSRLHESATIVVCNWDDHRNRRLVESAC